MTNINEVGFSVCRVLRSLKPRPYSRSDYFDLSRGFVGYGSSHSHGRKGIFLFLGTEGLIQGDPFATGLCDTGAVYAGF